METTIAIPSTRPQNSSIKALTTSIDRLRQVHWAFKLFHRLVVTSLQSPIQLWLWVQHLLTPSRTSNVKSSHLTFKKFWNIFWHSSRYSSTPIHFRLLNIISNFWFFKIWPPLDSFETFGNLKILWKFIRLVPKIKLTMDIQNYLVPSLMT